MEGNLIMKRVVSIILTVIFMIAMLTSCETKAKCDFCGEEKSCKTKTVLGDEIKVCNDCLDELNELY